MKLADLSAESRQRISAVRFDWIVEKHEGPWSWGSWLDPMEPEFLTLDGYEVLLPVEQDHHPNITPLRVIPSADGQTLTIFLTDTTYESEMFAGYLAVCEKVPGEDWYLALVYHEWFVLDHLAAQIRRASP